MTEWTGEYYPIKAVINGAVEFLKPDHFTVFNAEGGNGYWDLDKIDVVHGQKVKIGDTIGWKKKTWAYIYVVLRKADARYINTFTNKEDAEIHYPSRSQNYAIVEVEVELPRE